MKRWLLLLVVVLLTGCVFNKIPYYEKTGNFYARCNLKILNGKEMTWKNWQAAPEFLPAGTPVEVDASGVKATLIDLKSKRVFILDTGAAGDPFLLKFVSPEPPTMSRYSETVQAHIKDAVARIGMSKDAVYTAMGPPAWIPSGKTQAGTYEMIMAANLWVYKRRRFGKNIGVEFDPRTGTVIRTEGIWR